MHDGQRLASDPVDPELLRRLHEHGGDLRAEWRPRRAITAVVVFIVVDVLSFVLGRVVESGGASPAAQIGVTAFVLYGGLILAAVHFHQEDGTSAFAEAYGLTFRLRDIPWGFVVSIGARIAAFAVILPIVLIAPKTAGSNVPSGEALEGIGVLLAITFVAVIVAPIVEELYFRGFVQRSLETRFPPWLAIGVASLLFGFAHIGFQPGWRSVGIVLSTGVGGAAFGVAARVTRGLGMPIAAHMWFNAVVMAFLWAVR